MVDSVVHGSFSRRFRRVGVAGLGFGVLLLGLALIVLPVPGTTVVVIPLGLAILGKEFAWARRLLQRLTATARSAWLESAGDSVHRDPCGTSSQPVAQPPTDEDSRVTRQSCDRMGRDRSLMDKDRTEQSRNDTFLAGAGEMGELVRAIAWRETPLGPPRPGLRACEPR